MLTPVIVQRAIGCPLMRAENWTPSLAAALWTYGISAPREVAAWLAQVGHESGRLQYVRELWGPTPAQLRYEGRADLGNTQAGDGYRYRGRGLIQVTGRGGYCAARDGLRRVMPDAPDFEAQPELLEAPKWAALSAAEFWVRTGCGLLALAGEFEQLTRRINGGTNGLADRRALYASACDALGVVEA